MDVGLVITSLIAVVLAGGPMGAYLVLQGLIRNPLASFATLLVLGASFLIPFTVATAGDGPVELDRLGVRLVLWVAFVGAIRSGQRVTEWALYHSKRLQKMVFNREGDS